MEAEKVRVGEAATEEKETTGGGRKAALPEMEEELVAWVEGCREKNFRVTRISVQKHAAELAKAQGYTLVG